MNLAEMLAYADIQDLCRIAKTYDCDCSSNSKHQLIQSILSVIGKRELFEEQIGGLQTEDIRFLNSLLFDRRNKFSLEELMARANQTKFDPEERAEWNPRELIAQFKRRGWLFNGHSQHTRYLFLVPEDLKRRFREAMAKRFGTSLVATGREPAVYRDEQTLLSADLQAFLRTVGKQPLPLSADGYLYKKNLQQLLDGLAVPEEMIGRTAWRFGYGRRYKEYPDRFSLLYDFCYFSGLLEETGPELTLTPAGQAAATAAPADRVKELYEFWLKLYKGPIPNLQAIVHWIEQLAGDWVTVDSLEQVLLPLIKPYYYDAPSSILRQRILANLLHLGLLRLGQDEGHGEVACITPLGRVVIRGIYVPEEEKGIELSIDKL
ncbi:hypothetical protein J31TS4_07330 [Paenibacillus sp. J31TS4]|uniref:hypothetical protein n=1 Tax=Paenibacillus sp. J31TS4 TaxID=2807195 RepID=UPI001AFED9D1|nr:hypothetical protein [Paenibacillus sp. J31TS4]GIP37453.1 hypothetical protein J31TS4_07330 [Paenibacillus sp. J31TS4]